MEEVLQIAEERREAKGKGERERYTQHPTECRFPENSKEREEGLKRTTHIHTHTHKEENNRVGKTRDHLKKIRDTKEAFHARMSTTKDRNSKDLTEAEEIKKRWQEYTEELYKKRSS